MDVLLTRELVLDTCKTDSGEGGAEGRAGQWGGRGSGEGVHNFEKVYVLHEKLSVKVHMWVWIVCRCVGEAHVEVGGRGSCGGMVVGVMVCKWVVVFDW